MIRSPRDSVRFELRLRFVVSVSPSYSSTAR
jgi:hypothetical protein